MKGYLQISQHYYSYGIDPAKMENINELPDDLKESLISAMEGDEDKATLNSYPEMTFYREHKKASFGTFVMSISEDSSLAHDNNNYDTSG